MYQNMLIFGLSVSKMSEIRKEMIKAEEMPVNEFNEAQTKEIILGLEEELDVNEYADASIKWKIMKKN